MTDTQVVTTALVAARFFCGNLVGAKHYTKQHWGYTAWIRAISRDACIRSPIRSLPPSATCSKHLHLEARYVLDSFPVAVCHITRISRCKFLTSKAYYDRCASKRSWFDGLNVQVVATSDGILVEFYSHAGAESAGTGRRGLPLDLPAGSVCYTDASYPDYVAEEIFNEASGSQQQSARRKNSKRTHYPAQNFLIQYFRKGIETCFSQLTARLPKQIHAVTAAGFTLKIAIFIFAHALHQAGL